MDIRADEISKILKKQISDYQSRVSVSETGTILSIGDGIARIYGLENAQAGELLEFPGGVQGMVLNLEEDNVGAAILGPDPEHPRRRRSQAYRPHRGCWRGPCMYGTRCRRAW